MKQYQELSGKHEKTQLICDLDKKSWQFQTGE